MVDSPKLYQEALNVNTPPIYSLQKTNQRQSDRSRLTSIKSKYNNQQQYHQQPPSPSSSNVHQPLRHNQTYSVDGVLKQIGGHHCFQIFCAIVIYICYGSGNQINYSIPYLQSKKINLMCTDIQGQTFKCEPQIACNQDLTHHFDYIHDPSQTLVNWVVDFQLACESKTLISLMGSVFFIGFFVGSASFLILADIIGRKPIVILGLSIQILLSALINFWHNNVFRYIYLFLIGVRIPMACHIAYMILMEIVSQKYRSYFSVILNFVDGGVGNFLISGVFYFSQNWKVMFLITDIQAFLVLIIIIFFVPQSPRYLISKNQFDKARAIFCKIAKCNRRQKFQGELQGETESLIGSLNGLPSSQIITRQRGMRGSSSSENQINQSNIYQSQSSMADPSKNKKKGNKLCRLCKRSKKDLMLVIIVFILWLAVDIVYYGIGFGLNQLSGNLYANGVLIGIADMISCLSMSFIANTWGRKTAIIIAWGSVTIGCIVYDFVRSYTNVAYAAVFLGRYGASAGFALIFLITSETFPTEVRGTMFGVSNMIARFGGILAPLISSTFKHFMLILGGMGCISFILTFWLKETLGQKMEDFIDQEKNKGKNSGSDDIIIQQQQSINVNWRGEINSTSNKINFNGRNINN